MLSTNTAGGLARQIAEYCRTHQVQTPGETNQLGKRAARRLAGKRCGWLGLLLHRSSAATLQLTTFHRRQPHVFSGLGSSDGSASANRRCHDHTFPVLLEVTTPSL
jgi:hypothetical protein